MESRPDSTALETFSLVLLRHLDRYLMLRRSATKQFAPGRWTGIGGRVEPHEFDDLTASALREIREETGIRPEAVRRLRLRRTLLQQRTGHPLTLLLCFTGEVTRPDVRPTPEGMTRWLTAEEIASVDVIENSGIVIPLLMEDMERDPEGETGPALGFAANDEDGNPVRITWA